MKNKILFLSSLVACCAILVVACKKTEEPDSVPQTTSIPYIAIKYLNDAYVYGQGNSTLFTDVPDVIAVAVDSVVGFEGGYGGKTGSDSIKILKSAILGWPDTTGIGGYSIAFEVFNRSNFKARTGANIVIAGAIANPGPTAMEGTYKRTSNGVLIALTKVFDGVYVIDNPGGAGVPPFPYLFYNYKSSSGGDSLAFPIQTNPCGGGLQLVGPGAPNSLSSSDYSAMHPPVITATSPLTLSWRVYEFPSASSSSAHTGAALCQWGLGVRTFEKQ
jgi:hypothetical protein